eukprot:3579158-Pleurochrysis_carterae.AAC.4
MPDEETEYNNRDGQGQLEAAAKQVQQIRMSMMQQRNWCAWLGQGWCKTPLKLFNVLCAQKC